MLIPLIDCFIGCIISSGYFPPSMAMETLVFKADDVLTTICQDVGPHVPGSLTSLMLLLDRRMPDA